MSATEPALQCSILEHMPREEGLGAGKMTQHLQNPSQVVAKCRSDIRQGHTHRHTNSCHLQERAACYVPRLACGAGVEPMAS